MTPENDETHEVEAAALTLLDVEGKMEAVRRLTAVGKRRADLQAQLDEAERAYGSEHTAAVRAGWTDDQLARLGFTEPTHRPKGRPRGKASRTAGTKSERKTPSAPGPTDDTATPNGHPGAAGEGAAIFRPAEVGQPYMAEQH